MFGVLAAAAITFAQKESMTTSEIAVSLAHSCRLEISFTRGSNFVTAHVKECPELTGQPIRRGFGAATW